MRLGLEQAKIVSMGYILEGQAPITFETMKGERIALLLGPDQVKLFFSMCGQALAAEAWDEQERAKKIASNIFVDSNADVVPA